MRGCCEASPSAPAVQIIAGKQRRPAGPFPVCLSAQKMEGRSLFVFHPGRYKEGASLSFTLEDTRKEPVCLSPQKMQLGASLSFTPEDIRKEPVCLSPWKIQGRSQFVFHPRRYKEGTSVSFTPEDTRKEPVCFILEGTRKEPVRFTPEDKGRSQFVFHPWVWGLGVASNRGWVGWPAVGTFHMSWCDWGIREFQTSCRPTTTTVMNCL